MQYSALVWPLWFVEGMLSFVYSKDNTILEIVHVPSIMVKDSFLRLRKNMGPNVDLIATRKGLGGAWPIKKMNMKLLWP